MSFSKITITFCCLLLSSLLLNGQIPNSSEESGFQRSSALNKALVAPNTPESSSLGKFGEQGISAYTGAASVQVPITTISGKTTAIPINLIYDGTAIKVDQREGWTGVSWNLSTNFAITRNIAANPDLDVNYYSQKDKLTAQTNPDLFEENDLLYDIARTCIESQPDNFYLSGPFGSTKFYISPHKVVIQKEHQNLTITPTFESDGDISKFIVRDDKGINYEYATTEETNFFKDDQFQGDLTTCVPINLQYNSAWHLTKITGTNSIEEFFFEYESATSQYSLDINPYYYESVTYNPQNVSTPNCCGDANGSSTSNGVTSTSYIIGRKHLNEIKYVLGIDTLERVLFESTTSPCPYANNTDKKLDRIRCLKGENGEVNIKDYQFSYYTGGGDDCSTLDRLLLRSVQEKSPDGMEVIEPYVFAYDTTLTMPSYVTHQIDHFGYWNINNNTTLIPVIKLQGSASALNQNAANRNSNYARTHAGILEKVYYPTGGYSQYNWESHQAKGLGAGNYYDYNPTQDPAVDRTIGGLRIESIENYDCDGSLLTKRSWKYVKSGTNPTNQSSSGIMLNEINYTNTNSYNYCPIQLEGGGGACNTQFTCHRTTISATSRTALGVIKGSNVAYSRVEEIIESNDVTNETSGKTVYYFKNKKLNQFGLKDDVENGLLERNETYNADVATYIYSTDEGETRQRRRFDGFRVVAKEVQDNKMILCRDNTGSFMWTEETDSGINGCNGTQKTYRTKFERRFTEHSQRWVYQSEMTQTRYFYNGSGTKVGQVTTTTDYVYGDTTTNQPTETLVTNSDGKEYKTTTHFVNSFDDSEYPVADDSGLFVRAMQLKGMTSFPLVQAQYIDNQLVYKTKLNYRTQSNLTLPYKLYESFPTKTDVLAEVFDSYDLVGNLRQGHRHYEHSSGDTLHVTMIYSNDDSRMTAQIKNADIGEVAYTGFETQDTYQGGWTVGTPTSSIRFDATGLIGNGHFRNSSTYDIYTLVKGGRYIVSYYTTDAVGTDFNGGGVTILRTKISSDHPSNWTYVEHLIDVPINGGKTKLNLEVEQWDGIDELRLYPADALMTTFNYDRDNRLVVGIQDENSLPSYFEYDGLLRLTGVRNFDKHYISLNEYLYKNNTNSNNSVRSWTVLKEGQTSASTAKGLGNGDVVKVYNYYDGIGRDLMSVSVGTSAGGNDQIQFIEYDKFGRQVKKYLPFTLSGNNGAYINQSTVVSNQKDFIKVEYGESNMDFGFIETELESSPLNRVFHQKAAGSEFNSHPTETIYSSNGNNEVRNFHVMNSWYAKDDLFKIIQRDENSNQIITYTDKIGRKIMQDQAGSKTYFLYNNNGLLEQVIQPEAAQKGHNTPMLTKMDDQIKDGSFLYEYDNEHRMEKKVVPNCAAYTYFYDDLDQLVMTIDGNGFKTFTKYDKLGRPIVTGRYKGTAEPSSAQVVFEERSGTAPHYYTTNQSFPNDGNIDIYTVSYYDDYDINTDNAEEITYESSDVPNTDYLNYPYVRGLPTASKVAILKNDGTAPSAYLNAYTFYDQFRRVIHSRKDNHLNGTDKVWSNYNFAGWLKKIRRIHTTNIVGQVTTKTINERWGHDHIGRELQYYHEVIGDGAEKLVCEKAYNERDELITKKLGNTTGNNFLQTVDYEYNIRKWLTKINDPTNLGGDLFGMSINYTSIQQLGDTPNYNGNIGSIVWKNSGGVEKAYAYSYDNLNRLTVANYSQEDPVVSSAVPTTDQFSTTYTYDGNGNIKTLTRNGFTGSTFAQIDNLNYDYADDGALTTITENSDMEYGFKSNTAGGAGGYSYDQNGNMTSDIHKNMTVTYNHLNLPTKVVKSEGEIEWLYDAAGTKLSKTVKTDHLEVNANPILSKEYKASMTIESKGIVPNAGDVTFTAGQSITLKEGFTATEGSDFLAQIMPNNVVQVREYLGGIEYFESKLEAIYFVDGRIFYDDTSNERNFYLADYQGNSRVLIRGIGGVAETIEDYTYYPYGALHGQQSDYKQEYMFGGKELQAELNLDWSDFSTRCFDNWSAKWQGIDIMSEFTSQASPYGYTLGNPVRFSDPTGMLTEDEDGMIQTSTSLWGRDVTGGENTGEVLSSSFISEGQLARDGATTKFNEHAGEEVHREVVENGVNITYAGAFTEWMGLRKADLRHYAIGSGYCYPCSENELGRYFELIFEGYMLDNHPVATAAHNFRRNTAVWNQGTGRNTAPDFVANSGYLRFSLAPPSLYMQPVLEGSIYELKAKNGGVYLSSHKGQIRGHIDNLRARHITDVNAGFTPDMTLITTSDVSWSPSLSAYAARRGVAYTHRRAQYRVVNGAHEFRFVGYGLSAWDD